MRTISFIRCGRFLIDKKMNKKDLIAAAGFAKGTITRMGKNESVYGRGACENLQRSGL